MGTRSQGEITGEQEKHLFFIMKTQNFSLGANEIIMNRAIISNQ